MAVKQLAYSQDARQALWNGVSKLASAAKSTLGPFAIDTSARGR